MLMEERPGDPRALGAVDRAQRLARAGIEETAQAVAALRGESPPGPDSVPRLVRQFETETGVRSRFEIVGERVPVSPEAGVAIYRTAQEALTNIRRHADATEVTVRLVYGAERGIELTVSDLGRPKPSLASSGYGLTGIGERAALLGGRFESGSMPGGFQVRLWVPA
ncbi:MAG TPA: ATP-binding protein [Candidatus Dormibacteraeota bacterium]|jgi:signal transduction histidine kinase|nr:ATP-binding protein [Candidatus Dormibacteraeota bacterium]